MVSPQPVELQIVSGGISASAVLKNSTGCTLGSLKSNGVLTVTRQMSWSKAGVFQLPWNSILEMALDW